MERVFFLNPDLRIRMRAMGGLCVITLSVVARCALWIVLLQELGRFIDLIPDKHAFDAVLASAARLLEYGGTLALLQMLQVNFKLFYTWWWRDALIQECLALRHRIERARANRPKGVLLGMQERDTDESLGTFAQTVQESSANATRWYLETYDPIVYAVLSVVGNLVALHGQDAAFKFSWDVAPGCLVWGVVLVCVFDLLFTQVLGRKIPEIKHVARDAESGFRAVLEGGHEAVSTLDAYAYRARESLKELRCINARLRWHQVLVSLWQGPYLSMFEVLPWITLGLYVNYCSDVATVGMVSQAVGTIVIIKNGCCTFSANWSTSITDLLTERRRLSGLLTTLRGFVTQTEKVERDMRNVVPFRKIA